MMPCVLFFERLHDPVFHEVTVLLDWVNCYVAGEAD